MAFDGCGFERRTILGGAAAAAAVLRLGPLRAAEAAPLKLTAAPAKLALRAGAQTSVLAFDGTVPGPLIRLKLGGSVDVRLENRIDRPLALTWQGVRLPEAAGGTAGSTQAPVKPGGDLGYRFTPPDAGLFWYHPRVGPDGDGLVERGLYGVLLVDEPSPPPVDADLLVVIDDWMLGADGQIAAPGADAAPLLTANSHPLPMVETMRPGARVRLRLLNACSTRLALVTCSGMAASVIAVDGQPSGLFEPARGTVPIGPGSRFELILDLPRDAGGDAKAVPAVGLRVEGLPEQPLLRIALKGEPLPSRGPVPKLPDNPLLPTRIHLESSVKRDLVIAEAGAASSTGGPRKPTAGKAGAAPPPPDPSRPLAWTSAGRPVEGSSGQPFLTVKRGQPVTLAFVNRTAFAQQARVEGHAFRVLHDLDDGWDPYWRDTVLVGPGRTKHVAFVADNPGRWLVGAVALDRPGPGLAASFAVER